MHPLYSFGYQGQDVVTFVNQVQAHGLTVADLRLKPVSRNFLWNKNGLAERLGARYVWIDELGNLNYKGGPIALKAPDAGVAKLLALLSQGPAVAMCVCADPSVCHRTVVTDWLRDKNGVTVLPFAALTRPARQEHEPMLPGLL